MPGADVEYTASLNDEQILHTLRVIAARMGDLETAGNQHFKKMEQTAERSFKNVGRAADTTKAKGMNAFTAMSKGAALFGIQAGSAQAIVQELIRRFINLAEEAARAFIEIAKGGIELNKTLELLEIRTTAILEGNQAVARGFLENTRQVARDLKLDYTELSELAVTILPDANDLRVSAQLAGQTLLLARAIGADARRAQISIIEALAGQYVSIRRVLNLSSQQIETIKKLAPEIGNAAAISKVLGDRLETIGFDAEKIADSFTGLFGLLQSEAKQIQEIFARPIFEELKDQAQAFLEVLSEHRDDIEEVAEAFGLFAAEVVRLVGSNLVEFIDSVDYDALKDTAEALNNLAIGTEALLEALTGIGDATDDLSTLNKTINTIAVAFIAAAAGARALKTIIESTPAFEIGLGVGTANLNTIGRGIKRTFEDGVVDIDNLNDGFEETRQWLRDIAEEIQKTSEGFDDLGQATAEATEEEERMANALLKENEALNKLTQAQEDFIAARDKIREKEEAFAIESERRLLEININAERKRIEDEIGFAEKREDIARENVEKIEDIYRDHQDELEDAALDLSRAEQDIARKAARDRVEVDRDTARERVNIETEFRRELERIRSRFEESAAEAERRNDAQAFLEAVRQRDRDIEEARRSRSEDIEDASIKAAEQRQKINEQIQYEIEDARIANQRKLEDLQIRLDRELEAQRINYQRDLDEQTLNEERKRAERVRANDQELEDFNRKEAQKRQDLDKSEAEQFEIIRKYADATREYRVASAERTVAEVNAAMAKLNPFGGGALGGGTAPVTDRSFQYYYRGAAQRQEGGPVDAGRPYIVGERGPELFIPAMSGRIMPQVVSLPAPPAAQSVNNVSTTVAPSFNVAESLFNDPIAVRKLQNIVMSVLVEAL